MNFQEVLCFLLKMPHTQLTIRMYIRRGTEVMASFVLCIPQKPTCSQALASVWVWGTLLTAVQAGDRVQGTVHPF